jgi:Ran GTPase-activating protein (RanGAP) involved in mRNA processing and transport
VPILKLLAAHSSLETLALADNHVDDQVVVEITQLLEDVPLKQLNLSGNRMTAAGVQTLFGAIKKHKSLQAVDISGAAFDNCTQLLVDLFSSNKTLKELKWNGVGEVADFDGPLEEFSSRLKH